MIEMNKQYPAANRVVALYADCALSFSLPKTATFEQLAERLAELGDRHGGSPVMVGIRVAAQH
jgi:hypothetical protein